MVYFCADDYGISADSNLRIENCLKNGALNKVSVLPNGEIADFKQRLTDSNATLSLHINLVEGTPLSDPADVDLLITDNGYFKYDFIGLYLLSLSGKRKRLEAQLYTEIQKQIQLWKTHMGTDPVLLDSHQHTHMIPLVFKTLMRVIQDEALPVAYLRIPAEPLLPYISTPSLYLSYSPKGLLKQWLLRYLAFVNNKVFKKANIPTAYFMGAVFSGKFNEVKIKKLLPKYMKLAEKNNKDIEIGLHPGYQKPGEAMIAGCKESFTKFYFSPWRKIEHDTLLKIKH